jgi:hypothetical protein
MIVAFQLRRQGRHVACGEVDALPFPMLVIGVFGFKLIEQADAEV